MVHNNHNIHNIVNRSLRSSQPLDKVPTPQLARRQTRSLMHLRALLLLKHLDHTTHINLHNSNSKRLLPLGSTADTNGLHSASHRLEHLALQTQRPHHQRLQLIGMMFLKLLKSTVGQLPLHLLLQLYLHSQALSLVSQAHLNREHLLDYRPRRHHPLHQKMRRLHSVLHHPLRINSDNNHL